MKMTAVIVFVGLCLVMSIWFLSAGYSESFVPMEISAPVGNWMHIGDSDSTTSKFVCPNGKLIGDVWKTDYNTGVYGLHIYTPDSWDRIEENFKNEQFAKQAAEKFINEHNKICK
jgi:hypothetical protein